MLVETGIVETTGGTIRVKQPLEEIATPRASARSTRQRLTRLPPDTRDLPCSTSPPSPDRSSSSRSSGEPPLYRYMHRPERSPSCSRTSGIDRPRTRRLGGRYPELLAEHDRLLADAFGGRGGHQVDRQGDALFFTFRRARDAVQAAAEAQRSLAGASFPGEVDVGIRIGIHTREPGLAATGYHGLGVVKAARISNAAHGGQILVSGATRTLLQDELLPGIVLEDLGDYRLKDFDQPNASTRSSPTGLNSASAAQGRSRPGAGP